MSHHRSDNQEQYKNNNNYNHRTTCITEVWKPGRIFAIVMVLVYKRNKWTKQIVTDKIIGLYSLCSVKAQKHLLVNCVENIYIFPVIVSFFLHCEHICGDKMFAVLVCNQSILCGLLLSSIFCLDG